MLRNLIRIAVVLLIANALYRFVPVYAHYYQLKDAVKEAAMFAKDKSEFEIVDRVMVQAERLKVPVNREMVQVTRDKQFTYIVIMYEEQVEWLPKYKRRIPFTISVEGWHVKPASTSDAFK